MGLRRKARTMAEAHRLIGESLPNEDGQAIVTGAAKYTADIELPRLIHGSIVRSPHAHALIRSVDAEAARAEPGVLDVIVPADRDVARLPLVSTGPVLD